MNIMLQNHTFYPALGGIENYLFHVSKTFKAMGHQPIILCEKHDHKLSDHDNHGGLKIIRHPYYSIPKRLLFKKPRIISERLKDFISKNLSGIDLVISRYPHYCFSTMELGFDVPIFYIPPSVFWKQLNKASANLSIKARFFNSIWKETLEEMERQSILKSRKTIVFSKNNEDSLTRYYGLEESSLHVIPPGVEVNRFSRGRDSKLLEELNIEEKNVVLLYVGRLPPEKNVDRLLREFQSLRRDNLRLIIVGDGPERSKLEDMSSHLGVRKSVRFLGMREDVERFYSVSDIFVSPSKYEPFGQVILEAMAAGLPCIAFKRILPDYEVASEEIIENGATGFCVNPCDKDEFREKLAYLIDHADVRRKMGESGRRVCEAKFSWEDHVRRLLDLLRRS
ncbi:MAG: glycosyltransferase family 4 protein [Candidatus Hodarchaeota archaeon]